MRTARIPFRLAALAASLTLCAACATCPPPVPPSPPLASAPAQTGDTAKNRAPGDRMLDRLLGHWELAGTVHGKPVLYAGHGERVLGDTFVRLELRDVSRTNSYLAWVFLGYDAKRKDYIVHWLDRFGAPGARVVGQGVERADESLLFSFPYEKSTFRDTIVFDPSSDGWSLLIESESKPGTWGPFGSWKAVRKR